MRLKLLNKTTAKSKGKGKRIPWRQYFVPRTKKPAFLLSVIITTAWVLLVAMLAMCSAGLGAVVGVVRGYMSTTPALDLTRIEDSAQTSYIYDTNGQEIMSYRNQENRVWANYEELPEMLKNAVVAIEDIRFYQHEGLDYKRLFGAVISNFTSNTRQGGSTITQQLIKMRVLSSESTYKRKLQEAYLALQLEKAYSKEEILEAYVNTIPLGGSNYGVKAAAMDYFGKELSELTLRECATLAGITQRPNYYDPRKNYYERHTPEVTNNRADTVLKSMYDNGMITKQEYEDALADELVVVEKQTQVSEMYKMVYAVEYAVRNVVEYMLQQNGMENTAANRNAMETQIREGGYHIYTTIDPEIQNIVENTVLSYDAYPLMRDDSDKVVWETNPDGTRSELIQPQVAIVVMDKDTASVRAVMGGRQLPTRMKEFNRAWQSTMPVGSSIKPLTCFGPALDKGYSPASVVANVRAPIDGWDSELGYPKNYTESQYSGQMTLREGLRRSINVTAARALLDLVGLDTAMDYLQRLGVDIASGKVKATGSSLALGSAGITTLEMATAYCAVANSGYYQQAIAFTKMTDGDGNVILDPYIVRNQGQVYKESTAWMMIDMMKDAVSSGGTGSRAVFPGMTIAGKTGTNDDERGVFFSGITPYYVSTIWIGSDYYKPLRVTSTGGASACPLWKAYMQKIHEGLEDRDIIGKTAEESNVTKARFCTISGMPASDLCPKTIEDYIDKDALASQSTCTWHQIASTCSVSGLAAGVFCPTEVCIKSVVCVLPEDSIYRKYPETLTFSALLENHNANDVLKYDEGDPRLAAYCNVHTPQSGTSNEQLAPALQGAQRLYANAKFMLEINRGSLSDSAYTELTQRVDALYTMICDANVDPDALAAATDDLQKLLEAYFPDQQ